MTRERVAVAMSGGVDSSLAAALLVEQRGEVVGLTMQIWPREPAHGTPSAPRGCCGLNALDSARRVARSLDIPHYVLDLRADFEQLVIAPFCQEYARGRTPNPCIRCNTHLKFGALLRRAEQLGAGRLATGHYARVCYHEDRGRWALLRGVDRAKDQSYSLYGLRQDQLARAVFPLGEMRKPETRARAAALGLPAAAEPESQEICFTLGDSYDEYLQRRSPEMARPGPIVDRQGRQLGRHRGIAFYTIGQRQGLRVASGSPLYVVGIDADGNRLIVGDDGETRRQRLLMQDVNYVSFDHVPSNASRLRAKVRSSTPLAACVAEPAGDAVRLQFARPQRAISPGQAVVCYQNEAVAFGGTIVEAL
jgi:tRNA-specific 2-thiouridylase